jgi:dTDP-4-amino-4,6-dideoxygalactose transaminase
MTRRIEISAADIAPEERGLVDSVLTSGHLTPGPMVEAFEDECRTRFGARYAVAVSSGTAGLHLSVLAAGIGEGDLVLTTPFSFVASANVALYERAVPVFVDIDPKTLTMDVDQTMTAIEEISRRQPGFRERWLPRQGTDGEGALRAIVPVHVFGRPVEMVPIARAARAHGLTILEDACESIGAEIDGVPVGRWGDAGVFAFYPNKQITTGEGGIVLTDDGDWASLMRSLRSQGRSEHGARLEYTRLGYNYRLDEMSAALGLGQIRRLDSILRSRQAVAEQYEERLKGADGITTLAPPREGMSLSWFAYPVRLDAGIDRDEIARRLAARGIATRPYFWPIHLQPFYRERFGYRSGDFPHSEAAGLSHLALPFHSRLPPSDVELVCEALVEEVCAHPRTAVATR